MGYDLQLSYDLQLIITGGVLGFTTSALMAVLLHLLRSRRQQRQWKREEEVRILEWKRLDVLRKHEELKQEKEKIARTVDEKDAEIERLLAEEKRLLAENKQLRERILEKLASP